MITKVLEFISSEAVFENFKELEKYGGIETEYIASTFKMSRTQASRLLNELVKSNDLIKINNRPVKFLPRKKINDIIGPTKKSIYKDIYELEQECESLKQEIIFESIIGYDNSLKEVVEQIKTAVLYPKGD